ncbi:MAG: hypothetical protein LBJ72_12630 [Dysgonamonadaceae bacterium]|jgi:hypothetical protein|nr:hypothetical protein [Dysgonamonadaceae bacterium]
MRVDLLKFIQDWLFSMFRKPGIIEFIRSLLLEVPKAHNSFELFSYDAKYKANANASVISLEHHINREFDVKAKITELDGKPIDFLVTVTGTVDEVRLRSLIDKYKLAGKSYVFKIGEVIYTAGFINFECENIIEAYTVEFNDHVCEEDNEVYFTVTILPTENSGAANEHKWQVKVNSTKPVRGDLRLDIWVPFIYSDGQDRLAITSVFLSSGENEAYADLSLYETEVTFLGWEIHSITPNHDSYYNYNKN